MRPRNRKARENLQEYRNRDVVYPMLSDDAFSAWNTGADSCLTVATTGCLDALNELPAGSSEAGYGYFDSSYYTRGQTLEEAREEEFFANAIINEIISGG